MSHREDSVRLAVLEAVFERDASVREAASLYGVSKNSVWSWTRWHRSGHLTIEMLRAQGVLPSAPVGTPAMAHGPLRNAPKEMRPIDAFAEVKRLNQQRDRIREQLTQERVVVAERLEAIDEALAMLDAPALDSTKED